MARLARWSRHCLLRNPFYIVSAALLLLSMRLLSGDSRIFARETPQLLFNFSSFQFYELLLVGMAVLLARRKIWYDSGLLVGVEMMFVCVPFILISQALLLENNLVLAFCLTGCALAALRIFGLKRGLPELNMPRPLLWIGGLILALNFAFPVATRLLHEHVSVPIWDERGGILRALEWDALLPMLVGGAMFLPRAKFNQLNAEVFFTRASFPFLAMLLWVAGTAAQLYCIGYVYGMGWSDSLVTPTLWVAAWMFWLRQADFQFVPEKHRRVFKVVALSGPLLVALMAAGMSDWDRCFVLALLGGAVYGTLAVKQKESGALHLAAMSLMVALASVPHGWLPSAAGHFESGTALLLMAPIYLVFLTVLSRSPLWGLIGGIGFATALLAAKSHVGMDAYLAGQLALAFVLLHSLRWEGISRFYPGQIRTSVAVLWAAHSVMWLCADFSNAQTATFLLGFSVLVVYFCARGVFGMWGARIIPYTALGVMALNPACVVGQIIPRMPGGLLMLICSFGLFAMGTLLALTKHRWNRHAVVCPPPIPRGD